MPPSLPAIKSPSRRRSPAELGAPKTPTTDIRSTIELNDTYDDQGEDRFSEDAEPSVFWGGALSRQTCVQTACTIPLIGAGDPNQLEPDRKMCVLGVRELAEARVWFV